MKRLFLLFVVMLFVMTTSCKKEEATTTKNSEALETTITDSNNNVSIDEELGPPPPVDGKYPIIAFEKQEHDFGIIKQGDKVSYEFKFKNSGESDLIITQAKGSCGCTVPEYPKTPIKPGEDGKIKVSFDSSGKSGLNSKSVTLSCNTKEGIKIINIKANIEASLATK